MNFTEKYGFNNFCRAPLQWSQSEENAMRRLQPEGFNDTYWELNNILGNPRAVYRIWEHYSGTTVTFPQKLYSREYMLDYIRESIGKKKPSEIAHALGITDRRARQIIKQIRQEEKRGI